MFGNQAKYVPELRSHLSEECSYCYTRGLLPPPLETAQHFLLRECPIVDEYVSVIMKTVCNPDSEEHFENPCPFRGPPSSAFTEIYIYTLCTLLGMRQKKECNIKIITQNVYTLSMVGSKVCRGQRQLEFANIAINISASIGSLVRPPEDSPSLALIKTSAF